MQSAYAIPPGYPHLVVKDIPITLHFRETPNSFLALFGLTYRDAPVGVRKYVNYEPPKTGAQAEIVQDYQKIDGNPAFKGVAGRVIMYFDENDGWLHIHTDPPVAQRIVEIFKGARGEKKYRAIESMFGKYAKKQMKKKERLQRRNLLADSDRLYALLAEGQETRERHNKMDESFFREEGLEHLMRAKTLGDFISVNPMEISDMLIKETKENV